VLCVGEKIEERRAGRADAVVAGQLQPVLEAVSLDEARSLVVAYEPVWAIGTGEVATPDDAQEVCAAIRERIREVHGDAAADSVRVLYGGSVKAANVAGIMDRADVDGCLVGGASLEADEFGGICRFYDMPLL
jgi:triosephosphate isomerase